MAIYINGKKVAGLGLQGKSPYQVAKENGYTGTETEFNNNLVGIANTYSDIQALRTEVNTTCSNAITNINDVKDNAIIEINGLMPNFNSYYTKSEIDTKLEGIISQPYTTNINEPTSEEDKKLLWISSAGLKYHNGSGWVPVPVCWT